MPSLGADMESGTLLEWRVKPGDAVKRGDIVAVVDTSKAEIEIEIFEDGVIDELLVPEGARVPVGTVLATLTSSGAPRAAPAEAAPAAPARPPTETAAQTPAPAPAEATGVAPQPSAAPPAEPEPPPPAPPPAPVAPVTAGAPQGPPGSVTDHRARISPLAHRVAEQLGVDLSAVRGSGPGGAITKADVERSATAPPAAAPVAAAPEPAAAPPVAAAPGPATAPPGTAAPESPTAPTPVPRAEPADRRAAMRQAIGALMARSKREVPHYYLQTQIDMSRALSWLEEENLRRSVGDRLLPSVMLLSAVARAVREMPMMNGFWMDGDFRPAQAVHLGVAISLRGGGLIAPALHDADRKSLDELMRDLSDLVKRARAGVLRSSEMSDPTITVTNLGEQGVDTVHGVIYAPQVALVGFGAIRERPWAADGMLGARPVVNATLAADHRASDGHTGGRLLLAIDHHLQAPEEL
jgi:pyruvate dehydrogenase E2 component (dihydrolipoyllysine-residue acetyltransferase)